MLLRPSVARRNLSRVATPSTSLAALTRCRAPRRYAPITAWRSLASLPSNAQRERTYATLSGLDGHLPTTMSHDPPIHDIPFEGLPNSLASQQKLQRPQTLYDLHPFDSSNPLVLDKKVDREIEPQRIDKWGVPGAVDEMIAVFDACVYVGKLDRAAVVLKRLGGFPIDAERLMMLHDDYLSERLLQIQENPTLDGAEDMHRWFELEIQSMGRPHTTEMIAYMLKASLLTTRGDRLFRLVDRYMGLLPAETALESLYLAGILTAKDLATIVELCPVYNMPEGSLLQPLGHEATSGPPEAEMTGPEVLSTPQKGLGLKSVQRTLSMFSAVPIGKDIASLPKSEQKELQAQLERDTVEAALERWREENDALLALGLNPSLSSRSLGATLHEWHKGLEGFITQEMSLVEAAEMSPSKSQSEHDRCLYGPFLLQSDPRRLAAVTVLCVMNTLAMQGADRGVALTALTTQMAKVAEVEIQAQVKQKSGLKTKVLGRRRPLSPPCERPTADAWPLSVKAKLAAILLLGLVKTAKIHVSRKVDAATTADGRGVVSQLQPAFTHTIQMRRGVRTGVVVPNPDLIERMRREPNPNALARHLPMVAEPDPWTKFDKGGFLTAQVPLVRIKEGDQDQRYYAEAAIARGDMNLVLKGLDILGKTAWRINRPVFDVMLQVWNDGRSFANIPALNPDIPIPEEPEHNDDPKQRREWIRAVKHAEAEKQGLHSVRCFINFQLEIARAFLDQTFYFPHNIDFRGRAYPISAYLNHMGADHVRGLLRFAKGKPLGEHGLRWLKVHLANVYGYDKASLAEREEFTTAHLADIYDSAENPLDGRRWWLAAEDPWQTLSACFEVKAALDSPDPTQFVSHLPVHQDGTCNGLQHYAALGGDTWGAQQVNLLPGDKPADVYQAVADLVNEAIDKDAASGDPLAKYLQGKVTRKVVKQPVMTNVYGVTFMGARKQVTKQLDSLYPELEAETGKSALVFGSYIARHIFSSLSTMFSGAHQIQAWLLDTGSRICRSILPEQIDNLAGDSRWEHVIDEAVQIAMNDGIDPKTNKPAKRLDTKDTPDEDARKEFQSTVVWTTPLRMPVVQPYRIGKFKRIETCMQALILVDTKMSDPVNRSKQLQAFPPNFIHSLDASHMLLSALECDQRGLDFAAVHDSFWTHPCDVNTMNEVLRDSFIRIHSEDVIGRLAAEFEARYRGSLFLAEARAGSELAREIIRLRRKMKFSLNLELMVERKRQLHLQSLDPKEREQGKNMVTPASLFEQMSAQGGLVDFNAKAGPRIKDSTTQLDMMTDSIAAEDGVALTEGTEEIAGDDMATKEIVGEDREVMEEGAPLESGLEERKHSRGRNKGTFFWLPIQFPPVPQKGDFDVRMLKKSKYFFS